jgi:branched-chain amino acid transport system ATP-binding protein
LGLFKVKGYPPLLDEFVKEFKVAILTVEKIVKNFGGLTALQQVSLEVQPGEIRGLIGPNGSGKTTFFNILSGIYPVDHGDIFFLDHHLNGKKPEEVGRMGMARTFQEIQLFYDMTVLENVMVGCQRLSKAEVFGALFVPQWVKKEEQFIRERARECLRFVGLGMHEEGLARNISYGHQRLLEIARGLASEPKLMLLDEPAAGMNIAETKNLMGLIGKIRDQGVTVLVVEHNMKVVMNICEKVTVLNYGKVIAEGKPEVIQRSEQVIEAYLGKVKRSC